MVKKLVVGVAVAALVATAAAWSFRPQEAVSVPAGFRISVFADGLRGVRTLRMGPDGMMYAVLSQSGRIVRLDPTGDGSADAVVEGLNQPYGLAFHDGWMYVGETNRIVRLRAPSYATPEVVVPSIPSGEGHWTRDLLFGPEGMLYVAIGSSCNICEESDPRRAAIVRYRPDGSDEAIVADGIRNSAGLAVEPSTGVIWASQNERDNLGDDLPGEEINILSDGEHFGWPYCYGDRIPNPEFSDRAAYCRTTTPPALSMQAHSAPLGMVFYTGGQFPAEYRGDLFLAFHGSWNRSVPTGFKLVRVRVENGRPVSYEDFATGWQTGRGRPSGRPVDPMVGPDGSLYLSDDGGGRIYRIQWTG